MEPLDDPVVVIERLRRLYGDEVAAPIVLRKKTTSFGACLATLLLAAAALSGAYVGDHLQNGRGGGDAELRAAAAGAAAHAASLRAEAARSRAEADRQLAEAGRQTNVLDAAARLLDAKAHLALSEAKEAEIAEVNAETRQQTARKKMWVSFRNSIIEFAPPALLMTSILLVIAAALASFVPWVEQQIGKLFETVVNGVYDAVKRKPRSSGAGSGSFAQSSLAALGVRSAMVTGAAVVTVGALALAVPGNTLPMKLGTPPDASASLSVGTFALKIPGKPIDLPLEVVPPAPAKLNVPRVELRLPELVPANGGALDRFTQELAAYRRFLERERSRQKENESLLAENRLMAWRTNALYEALLDRPTRDDFEALRTDVRRQRAASERLSESIDHAAEAQKFQSRLQVAELARHINGQNDHLYTALFRRSMAHQNCEIFSFLAQVDGGGFLNRSGCIERGRTDAIRQIWQQSAPALLANTQTQTVAERRKP